MTTKKEFSAVDASPVVLYAKTDPDSQNAYPVIATSNGSLLISAGLSIPAYDFISFSPADSPTTILFKVGGSGGSTVATLTLTYSGSDVATVQRT